MTLIELPSGVVTGELMREPDRPCPRCHGQQSYWVEVGLGTDPDGYECARCGHRWEELDPEELDLNDVTEP